MDPITLAILAAVGAGGIGFSLWKRNASPKVQVLQGTTPAGVKVAVALPVIKSPSPPSPSALAAAAAQRAQATAMANATKRPPPPPPQAKIITPTGAANMVVKTTKDVQNAINALGIIKGGVNVSGVVDKATKAAVGIFSAAKGIASGGISGGSIAAGVTGALSGALGNLAASALPKASSDVVKNVAPVVSDVANALSGLFGAEGDETLHIGLNGPQVADLQKALNEIGAKPALKVDGYFGPTTATAVQLFQIFHKFVPTGIATPDVVNAIHTVAKG
jgi:peptidoglycan hydrolase-like protein with peptidoglycan-binding domain